MFIRHLSQVQLRVAPSPRSINMADVSHAAALAAITREESRGGHTRDDFPTPEDDHWETVNVIWMENGEMKIRQEPVEEMRDDLKDALKEVKAMIAEAQQKQEVETDVLKGTKQSFNILRGEGDDAQLQAYELELDEGMVVSIASIAFSTTKNPMAVRWNCKAGKCGSCSAEINGRPA